MDEKTKNLVCLLLTDSDPDVRRRAAENLAECGEQNILPLLSIALQDENKGVEDAVARSFLTIGGTAAARAIVHHLGDENIASRNQSAKLLIKLGEASVHALVPYLRDAEKDIRKLAVDILGEIKSKETIYYLLPLLKDPDPNVLVATLEALGNIGCSEAFEPICRAFEHYPFARIVAIEALGKIGGDSVRDFLESRFEEALRANNVDGIFIFALLDAIGIVGNVKTLKLLHTHYDNIESSLRDVLLHDMVQITERCNLELRFEEKTRDDLLHALRNDNQFIKLSAAKGLVQFKDPIVTRALLLSLAISEEMDFVVIAQMSDRPQIFQIAIECLKEEISRGKIQIIMLLGKLASEFIHSFSSYRSFPIDGNEMAHAFDLTIGAWYEANQEDREIIVDTLFRLDCDRAAEFLDSVVVELDPWSRIKLIEQLLSIPTRRALDFITRLADDENDMVQDAAVSALKVAGYPSKSNPPSIGDK